MTHFLIRIQKPASISLRDDLPDSLECGAVGGFHPCGMWDYIIDSHSLVWCGIQFYLSNDIAKSLESANPRMDPAVTLIRKPSDAIDGRGFIDRCAVNNTSHILEVAWSRFARRDIIPALEYSDSWYASGNWAGIPDEEWFNPRHEFVGIGILNVGGKVAQYGLTIPGEFAVPFFDRSNR